MGGRLESGFYPPISKLFYNLMCIEI